MKARPLVWANGQAALWRKTGLMDVVEVPIVQSFDYGSFEDYWSSWSTGPTRIAQRLQALPREKHAEIERHVRAGYLAGLPDGSAVVRDNYPCRTRHRTRERLNADTSPQIKPRSRRLVCRPRPMIR